MTNRPTEITDHTTETDVDAPGPFGGWLTKHADGLGKSRKRFFVLEGATISYYEDEAGKHVGSGLKGAVNLEADTSVTVDGKDFRIVQSSRTWRLTATSEQEVRLCVCVVRAFVCVCLCMFSCTRVHSHTCDVLNTSAPPPPPSFLLCPSSTHH